MKCEVKIDLRTTSDHETLVINIYKDHQALLAGKLTYKAINNYNFLPVIFRQTLK